MNRYAVVGDPIAHSLSPWLHAQYARQTQRRLVYAALRPAAGDFAACATAFFASNGTGLNVTLPYKAAALAYADSATAFARRAGAANVLARAADGAIRAYNTDGAGLVADLHRLLGQSALAQSRIHLIGAGGAARAAAHALADVLGRAAPTHLTISNRTSSRAAALAAACNARHADLAAAAEATLLINATSAGHTDPPLYPPSLFAHTRLAYDISYGQAAQNFLTQATAGGAAQTADGTGMLAWQAALSFAIWENVLPTPQPAIDRLLRHNAAT